MVCVVATLSLLPHLAACVHTVEHGVGAGVPEAYAAVGRAATARQQPVLVRRPSDRLDSCSVLCEARQRGAAAKLKARRT